MTIREFYEKAEGDYEEVLAGLGKDERILKYLRKFPESNAVQKIGDALAAQDYETAFREAHNLKGMSLNMALKKLSQVSSDLTESLRHGPVGDVDGLYAAATAEYERVCSMITEIQ